jgi:hypothetical protein
MEMSLVKDEKLTKHPAHKAILARAMEMAEVIDVVTPYKSELSLYWLFYVCQVYKYHNGGNYERQNYKGIY